MRLVNSSRHRGVRGSAMGIVFSFEFEHRYRVTGQIAHGPAVFVSEKVAVF
jgi:hypothetical protein